MFPISAVEATTVSALDDAFTAGEMAAE